MLISFLSFFFNHRIDKNELIKIKLNPQCFICLLVIDSVGSATVMKTDEMLLKNAVAPLPLDNLHYNFSY